jgi:hypothetical protein
MTDGHLTENPTQLIVAVTSVLLKLSRTPPLELIISIKSFFVKEEHVFPKVKEKS